MSVLFPRRASRSWLAAVSALSLMALPSLAQAQTPPPPHPAMAEAATVAEQDLATLQARLTRGELTSEALVRAYLYRIGTLDQSGPGLNSVLSVNPDALKQARALDAERKAGKVRGPLHGLPVLLKDNIETLDPLPTTAGSLA
ncbi:MAG: amidase family protein, partial [Asticcacaulis sp.]